MTEAEADRANQAILSLCEWYQLSQESAYGIYEDAKKEYHRFLSSTNLNKLLSLNEKIRSALTAIIMENINTQVKKYGPVPAGKSLDFFHRLLASFPLFSAGNTRKSPEKRSVRVRVIRITESANALPRHLTLDDSADTQCKHSLS
jgi:hypothetical protein